MYFKKERSDSNEEINAKISPFSMKTRRIQKILEKKEKKEMQLLQNFESKENSSIFSKKNHFIKKGRGRPSSKKKEEGKENI